MLSLVVLALAAEHPPSVDTLQWAPDDDLVLEYALRNDVHLADTVDLGRGRTVRDVTMTAKLRCVALPRVTGNVRLDCTLSEVELAGKGATRDALAPFGAALEDTTVAIVLGRDGRLRTIDLEGPDADGWVTTMLQSALAGFDLQLPEAEQAARWSQRHAPWLHPRSPDGPLSRSIVEHRKIARAGALVNIESRGTLHRTWFDVALRPTEAQEASFAATAVFDSVSGYLTDRVWTIAGDALDPHLQSASLTLLRVEHGRAR